MGARNSLLSRDRTFHLYPHHRGGSSSEKEPLSWVSFPTPRKDLTEEAEKRSMVSWTEPERASGAEGPCVTS